MKELKEYIRSIPDFPEKGIIFRDVTSVLQDADALKLSIDELAKRLEGVDFDVIAGAESRGFIFGAPLAYVMHKPFVPIRKKGKLPCETVEKTYDLEYGTATIEMHKDAIQKGEKVVLLDDLIATGGTMKAAAELVPATPGAGTDNKARKEAVIARLDALGIEHKGNLGLEKLTELLPEGELEKLFPAE